VAMPARRNPALVRYTEYQMVLEAVIAVRNLEQDRE
jgi:hypothetical protein